MKSIAYKLIVANLKHLRANIYIVTCEKILVRGVDRGVVMVSRLSEYDFFFLNKLKLNVTEYDE